MEELSTVIPSFKRVSLRVLLLGLSVEYLFPNLSITVILGVWDMDTLDILLLSKSSKKSEYVL